MKILKIFLTLIFIALAFNCSYNNESTGILINRLKINRWGPENTKVGEVPNKQPDGKMGIWIDVSSTEGMGEIQLLFDGKSMLTAIEPKLITAGIPAEEFATPGDKKIEIQSLETGEIITVGIFRVDP